MITRLSKITNVAVFDAYEWPQKLEDFAARNVIYGWNYSGKTTLSRIVRSLAVGNTAALPEVGRFELLRDGVSISSESIRSPDINVRVFNADTVDASLLWNGGADPILVIGEDSVLLQKQQEELKSRLAKSELLRARRDAFQMSLQSEIDRNMSEIAVILKNKLSLPVFNRSPHLSLALQAAKKRTALPNDADVSKWWGILNAEEKKTLRVTDPSSDWTNGVKVAQNLLARIAIRVPIERLMRNHALSSWVSQGVGLHEPGDVCAFCDSSISEDRWKLLRQHHSDSVVQQNQEIRKSLGAMPLTVELHIPADSETYSDLGPRLAKASVSAFRIKERVDLRLSELRSGLEEKLSVPDDVVERPRRPITKLVRLLKRRLEKIAEIVDEHNRRVAAGVGLKANAREMLTEHISYSLYAERGLQGQQDRVDVLVSLIEKRKSFEKNLRTKIEGIEKELGARSIGAERVNYFLKMYFGTDRLKVVSTSGRFQLMRSDVPARHLSEGEKTAIAFSYFIAKLEEVNSDLSKMIVYVDDPISSLDSNHVFNTFSIIKSKLRDCRQLFVSTHNFEFFRLLKTDAFFAERRDKGRVAGYYYISRVGNSSILTNLPESVRKYSSEYHLLFDAVLRYRDNSAVVDYLLIPNILRRLLETYTKFRFPSAAQPLDQRLSKIFDEEDSIRVYKLINHLSHSDNVSALYEFPDKSEIDSVLGVVLNGLEKFDPNHVNGMREACVS